MKVQIPDIIKSKHNIQVIDFLFTKPKFSSTIFIKQTGIPKQTAMRIIDNLEKNQIITRIKEAKGRTPDYYSFGRLISISK